MAFAQIWGIVMGLYIGLPPTPLFGMIQNQLGGTLPVRKHRFCFVQCTFQLCGGNVLIRLRPHSRSYLLTEHGNYGEDN